jgi:hypothetical protein
VIIRTLFALILILLMASCTKFGKNVTIKGRIMNPITGKGIEGAEIWLQKTAGGYDGGYKTVKKATSGSDGAFELNKLGLAGYSAICGKFSGDYYELGWTQDNGASYTGNFKLSVKKGKIMHADYYAVPYGNLQINIHNTSCFDSNDELKIFRTHSIEGFYDNVPNPAIYTGCVNQTGNMNKAPMGWYKYNGTVTKNGIVTSKRDSIYLNEGETKIWNINY